MAEVKFGKSSSAEQARRSGGTCPEFFTPMMPFGAGLFGLNPFAMMKQVAEELDKAFTVPKNGAADDAWVPKIDWRRSNGTLVVSAELPGVKREDLKVEITREGLILEGNKQCLRGEKETACRSERRYGHFYRFIPLPEGANTDSAVAELTDGVLTVTVPLVDVEENRRALMVK